MLGGRDQVRRGGLEGADIYIFTKYYDRHGGIPRRGPTLGIRTSVRGRRELVTAEFYRQRDALLSNNPKETS
jgi:hypothetical protein